MIAANRGYCFGVGFEISLACDFRLVTPTTLYALPEQKLGQIPGSGGSARLQKMVGITRTKDIVMRSRRIPGAQAADWGVATECVPDAELEQATYLGRHALEDALAEVCAQGLAQADGGRYQLTEAGRRKRRAA